MTTRGPCTCGPPDDVTCAECGGDVHHERDRLRAALAEARELERDRQVRLRQLVLEGDGWWRDLCAVGRALDAAGVPAFGPPHRDGSREMRADAERVRLLAEQRDAALAIVRDIARGGYLREEDYSCCYCCELIVAGLGHRSDCPWLRAVELTDAEEER